MADAPDGDDGLPSQSSLPARIGRYSILRRVAPVFWYEREGIAPFWAVTRHEDVLTVSRRSDVFVNSRRLRLQTIEEDDFTNYGLSFMLGYTF